MDRFSAESGHTPEPHADEDRLLTAAVAFLGEGLRSGEPGIAIATEAQLRAIARGLAVASVNVEHARHTRALTFVDAHQMLDTIIVNGEPDAARFTHHVGTVIDAALSGSDATLARVYSGAVDLLSRRGHVNTATQLERLFYGLARTHAFSLLCAHAMGDLYKDDEPPQRQSDPTETGSPGASDGPETPSERAITNREGDVLRRTAFGHSNKDIANALNISVRTVEAHKANAMRKLGLTERADMIRFAMQKGWLTIGGKEPG